MRITLFFGAGLARQDRDDRRLALHQEAQRGMNGAEILELVEALGARAQFARSLRAAKEENAENRDFMAMEVEDLLETVLVLGHPAVCCRRPREAMLVEGVKRAANGVFFEVHDRVAIGFLVAGVEEGVDRQRIVFGSGNFFFDERAEDAGLDGCELKIHSADFRLIR